MIQEILTTLQHWDFAILNAVKTLHTPFLDWLMPWITALGNGGIFWIVLAVVLLCVPKTRKCGCAMAFALLLVLLLGNCLLKPLIARPRPFTLQPEMVLLISPPEDFSFPSGHTYSGVAAAVCLLDCNRKWGIAAITLALLIAFSRLYLMVHFFTDVLGGIVLGTLCGLTAVKIMKTLRWH